MNKNLMRPTIFLYIFCLVLPFLAVKKSCAMELVDDEKEAEVQKPKPIKGTIDLFACMHAINKNFLELLDCTITVNKKVTIQLIQHNLDNLIEAVQKYYELKKFDKSKSKSKSSSDFRMSTILSSEQLAPLFSEASQSETQKLIDKFAQQLEIIKKVLPTKFNHDFTGAIFDAMALFNSIFSVNLSAHCDENIKQLRKEMSEFIGKKDTKSVIVGKPPKAIQSYISYIPTILRIVKYLPQGAINTTLDYIPINQLGFLVDAEALKIVNLIFPVIKKLLVQKGLISNTTEAIEQLLQDQSIQTVLNAVIEVADEAQANLYLEALQHCSFIEFLERLKENHGNSLALLEGDYKIKQKKDSDEPKAPVGSIISYDEHKTHQINAQISKALFDSELSKIIYSSVGATQEWNEFIELQKKLQVLHGEKANDRVKLLFKIQNLSFKRDKFNKKKRDKQNANNYDLQIEGLKGELKKLTDNPKRNEEIVEVSLVIESQEHDVKTETEIDEKAPDKQGWFSTLYSYVPSGQALNPLTYLSRKNTTDSETIKVTDIDGDDFTDSLEGMSESESENETTALTSKIKICLEKIIPIASQMEESIIALVEANQKIEKDLKDNYNEQLVGTLVLLLQKRKIELRNLQTEKSQLPWLALEQYIKKRYEISYKKEIFINTTDLLSTQIDDLPVLMEKKFKTILDLKQQSENLYWFKVFRKMQYEYEIAAEQENLNLMIKTFNTAKINTHYKNNMDTNSFQNFGANRLQHLKNLKDLRTPDRMKEIFISSQKLQPQPGQPNLINIFTPLERIVLAAEFK